MSFQRAAVACGLLIPCVSAGAQSGSLIGDGPAIVNHVDQADIIAGKIKLRQLADLGEALFNAKFNMFDGQGRPKTTGTGAPREAGPNFIRTSGPDANSCFGCHNEPRSGGSADIVANVFVLAQALDPVTESISPELSNSRNSLGMFGSGPIEMLAREMSFELEAIREEARAAARSTGRAATRALVAKGVSFGTITVLPDGRIDPTGIEGVDWDLIIKPFHQKGAVVSLRDFSNTAMNHHHGMQSVERFGLGADPDGDEVTNELTVGDITALTIFQASLPVPGRVIPAEPARRAAVLRGETVFASIGCTVCHIPQMTLNSRFFTEPNPFNGPGNLRLIDAPDEEIFFDMTSQPKAPRLQKGPGGTAIIRAFTDLKRHDLNDEDFHAFANEQVPQGSLAGFAPASDFTIPPPPRPTREFLTRKLWDAGSSAPYGHAGDLTTLTEAIYYHGGEARTSRDAFFALSQSDRDAVIEFLKSMQVLPQRK